MSKYPWLKREHIIVRAATPAAFAAQLATSLAAVQADGFDIVLDAVAGSFMQPGYDSLAPGGKYVVYGSADWTPTGDKTSWLRLGWQYLQRFRLDPLTMVSDNKGTLLTMSVATSASQGQSRGKQHMYGTSAGSKACPDALNFHVITCNDARTHT